MGVVVNVDDYLTLIEVEGDLSDAPGMLETEDLSV